MIAGFLKLKGKSVHIQYKPPPLGPGGAPKWWVQMELVI